MLAARQVGSTGSLAAWQPAAWQVGLHLTRAVRPTEGAAHKPRDAEPPSAATNLARPRPARGRRAPIEDPGMLAHTSHRRRRRAGGGPRDPLRPCHSIARNTAPPRSRRAAVWRALAPACL